MKKFLLALLMILIVTPAFAYRKVVKFKGTEGQFSNEKDGKGVNGHLIWIKNKLDTIDISLSFENNYSKSIYIDPSNIKLTFNGVKGALWPVKKFSGQLAPGELTVQKVMIFEFEPNIPKEGELVLTIKPIIKTKDSENAAAPLVFEMQMHK